MSQIVGISNKIKRIWLDTILDKVLQIKDNDELRSFMDQNLMSDIPGIETRRKSIGILMRIWKLIPPERVHIRDRALVLLPRITGHERIWLHWGMTMLAYPFFRDTVEIVGRRLSLQDDFTTIEVQGRLLTNWGDRSTTKFASQKLLNTLVDWEVLRATGTKGGFLPSRKMKASTFELELWLLEVLIAANNANEIEAQQLLRLPEAFPFQINVGMSDLRRYQAFNIHRQGLDMDMVALHKVNLATPLKIKKKIEPVPNDIITREPVKTSGSISKISKNRKPTKLMLERDSRLSSISDSTCQIALNESARLISEGYYYGCISLSCMTIESIVRDAWQNINKRNERKHNRFDQKVDDLHNKGLINGDLKIKVEQIWSELSEVITLRPRKEKDCQDLNHFARNCFSCLCDLIKNILGIDVQQVASIRPSSQNSDSSNKT